MPTVIEQTLDAPARYKTAADWWESLGEVPLNRIVFNPWPGTATEADVIRLDAHEDRLCELIDGTLVEKPMGFIESLIAARLVQLLKNFVSARKLGIVSGADGMMRLLAGRVRIPDIAFISNQSLPGGKVPHEAVPLLTPDLAVEVISESNTRKEMGIKLQEYFTAGTRLVWYSDPDTRSIDVYSAVDKVQHLSGEDILDGGEVLPGFQAPLPAVFDLT